jgi:ABC-type multidrug transport system ATPase subunit
MKIVLENVGKRYNTEWIFRNINFEFQPNDKCVLLGANGSGKSSLLQLIAGSSIPSEGKITYASSAPIEQENIFRQLSIAAPYLELIEEYSLKEMIDYHCKFKPFYDGITTEQAIAITQLDKAKNKIIKNYSSGMKQRIKLALAILSDTPLLLLDEPLSNLDAQGIDWYKQLIHDYAQNRLVIVCSNRQKQEYEFCNRELDVENFKKI